MQKTIIILILLISICFSQNIGNIYSNDPEGFNENSLQMNQNKNFTNLENLTYTPVGEPIDPDTYILGPGDLIGININSTTNVTFPIRVNPVGEILIPSIGVVSVNGYSLTKANIIISDYIGKNALQNAVTKVTLLDVKRFRVKILGAVNNPGSVNVTSIDGIYEAILKSGGLHRLAHPDLIHLYRNGNIIKVYLNKYLSGSDLSQNLNLIIGDSVYIPFNEFAVEQNLNVANYSNSQIIVYGFVNKRSEGNIFNYLPGYSVKEYIALAGGTKEPNATFNTGNIKRAVLHRANGKRVKNAYNEIVMPGDMIEVPPSLVYQIVGGDGIIKTVASIASSAYIVYKFTQDK